MSSEIERIKKEIFERLDQVDRERMRIKDLLKQLPQNGESEEDQENVDAVLELLRAEIRDQVKGSKKGKIDGEKRFKNILKTYIEIKNLKNIADVEALSHARGDDDDK